MFGEQGSSLNNQLRAAGLTHQQSNALAQIVGQCQATLVHRGSASFFGPMTLGGPGIRNGQRQVLVDPARGAMLFDGQPSSYYLDGDNATYSRTPGFRRGVLAGDLIHDGTQNIVLADSSVVAVIGYFVKSGWKIPSGQRVGALLDEDGDGNPVYVAIVNDDCLVTA